mmetsp:Transcript_150071/g.272934  ORF Transcript_150071/g.272934 Transcript_150071/m.272934 type:complete len:223 (-) Transcript_150071:202-870(-)
MWTPRSPGSYAPPMCEYPYAAVGGALFEDSDCMTDTYHQVSNAGSQIVSALRTAAGSPLSYQNPDFETVLYDQPLHAGSQVASTTADSKSCLSFGCSIFHGEQQQWQDEPPRLHWQDEPPRLQWRGQPCGQEHLEQLLEQEWQKLPPPPQWEPIVQRQDWQEQPLFQQPSHGQTSAQEYGQQALHDSHRWPQVEQQVTPLQLQPQLQAQLLQILQQQQQRQQ